MKNPLAVLGIVVVSCIALPIAISAISYNDISKETTVVEAVEDVVKEVISYETVNGESPVISVYNSLTSEDMQIDIENYLYGVLAGEMPSDFNIEALKAQAVAARTYVMYKKGSTNSDHTNSVVCTDYSHCQEYKSYDELLQSKGEDWMKESYPKIQQAVDETKGQIIVYEDEPILPLYFSTSSGKTENSEEVFSQKYAYLQSVESPYDEFSPKYTSNLEISKTDFVNKLKNSYSDIEIDENNLVNQINIIKNSTGGAVEKIQIGNKEMTGRDVRSIFGLNSANFEISFKDDYINFDVKGYGHGVGMSQWGATGMADDGYLYYEILAHYYLETTIKDLY